MPKTQPQFVAGISVSKGDAIQNPADTNGGYHVVLKDHTTGTTAPKPGESNDYYHYSLGPASAGKM